jgi:glutamine amidotransferase
VSIKGKSLLFPSAPGLKIPHMGWNSIKIKKGARLLSCLKGEPYMYFVHSYYVKAADQACVAAVTDYSVTFDASVEQGCLFGCQFHPEKSGEAGLAVLRRFTKLAGGGR